MEKALLFSHPQQVNEKISSSRKQTDLKPVSHEAVSTSSVKHLRSRNVPASEVSDDNVDEVSVPRKPRAASKKLVILILLYSICMGLSLAFI